MEQPNFFLNNQYSSIKITKENENIIEERFQNNILISKKIIINNSLSEEELLDENGEVDYPYGWVSKEIEIEGNGVHTFAGWSYN